MKTKNYKEFYEILLPVFQDWSHWYFVYLSVKKTTVLGLKEVEKNWLQKQEIFLPELTQFFKNRPDPFEWDPYINPDYYAKWEEIEEQLYEEEGIDLRSMTGKNAYVESYRNLIIPKFFEHLENLFDCRNCAWIEAPLNQNPLNLFVHFLNWFSQKYASMLHEFEKLKDKTKFEQVKAYLELPDLKPWDYNSIREGLLKKFQKG